MLSAKNFIKIHTVIALLSLPSHSAKTKHKDSDQVFVGFAAYNSKLYQMFRKLLPIDALNNGYIFVDGDDAIKFEEKTVFNDEVHFDDRGNRLFAEHMFTILNPLIDEIVAEGKLVNQ